jgi:hypothetical protein
MFDAHLFKCPLGPRPKSRLTDCSSYLTPMFRVSPGILRSRQSAVGELLSVAS